MKKLFAAALTGTLFLAACNGGGAEEESAGEETEAPVEETTVEESAEEAIDEASADDSSVEPDDAGSGDDEETAEGSDGTESAASEDKPQDLTQAEIDGETFNSAYDAEEDKGSMIKNAVETDRSVDDVLKDPSEVTSYMQDTSIIIEITEGKQVLERSFRGILAEVDEADGLEVASDYFDENLKIIQPHGYGNSETGEVFMFTDNGWADYSAQYGVRDLIYGIYSNVHDMIEQMPDSLQVLEEGNYDILYYTGNDEIVHQLYQDNFKVEFTGADMTALEMGFVAFINKASGELESANLIATAPGIERPEQVLTIEIILNYQEYGLFDKGMGVKKPSPDDMGGSARDGSGE